MSELRKRANLVIAVFCLFLCITLSLLSLVCYLSFDQNYREIKQSYYSTLCGQVITEMETSVRYGKRIDRYYGIEDVFERTQALFDEGFEVSILDSQGQLLYTTCQTGSVADQIIHSEELQAALEEYAGESYSLINRNNYEALLMPIDGQEGQAGYFLLEYPMSVYASQRTVMLRELAMYLGLALVAAWRPCVLLPGRRASGCSPARSTPAACCSLACPRASSSCSSSSWA